MAQIYKIARYENYQTKYEGAGGGGVLNKHFPQTWNIARAVLAENLSQNVEGYME